MENRDNNYQKLLDDTRTYLRTRYDLLRLELLEKMSQIIALILLVIIVTGLSMAAFVYFSFALVEWMQPFFGSRIVPLCIVGGGFLLVVAVACIFRNRLFVNPLIAQLSKILFRQTQNTEQDEQ